MDLQKLAAAAFLAALPALATPTVSFTFDDGLDPRSQPEAATWNAQMLRALGDAKVTAAYFPACRFVDSPEGWALVRAWGMDGHHIANHTYSHTDIDQMTVEAYTGDIAKCDAMLKAMPNFRPWLRFPYLREGATREKRDGVREWLAKNGYAHAPVTIVTSDWYYNGRLAEWSKKNPGGDLDPYRKAYLQHVWEAAEYSERLARELLGRSPPHVMLLHTNRTNALFLPEVIAMFRGKGWRIVSVEAALSDPLYRRLPEGLPAGNGLLGELMKDAGRKPPSSGNEDFGKARLDALGY